MVGTELSFAALPAAKEEVIAPLKHLAAHVVEVAEPTDVITTLQTHCLVYAICVSTWFFTVDGPCCVELRVLPTSRIVSARGSGRVSPTVAAYIRGTYAIAGPLLRPLRLITSHTSAFSVAAHPRFADRPDPIVHHISVVWVPHAF